MTQVYKDIIRLTIDLKTGVKEAIAPIKQADNLSRVLRCQLVNNGKPVSLKGSQLMLYVIKADFKQCVINGIINEGKAGIVDFELTEQSLILAKDIQCEIVKIDEGDVLLSFPVFKIGIDGALYDNGLVESTNEFSALTALISNVASWENRFVGECERIEEKFDGKISEVNTQLSKKADRAELSVERARIDNLTKLGEGSTTGDAELIDARVGANGITYSTLGDSIRQQISNNITPYVMLPYNKISGSYIQYNSGAIIEHPNKDVIFATDYIELMPSEKLYLKNLNYDFNDNAGLAFYDGNKNYVSGYQYNHETDLAINIPTEATFVRVTGLNSQSSLLIIYQDQHDTSITLKNSIDEVKNEMQIKFTMRVDYKTTFEDNFFIDYRSGYKTPHNYGAFSVTDYIELNRDYDILKILNLNYTFNDTSGMAFYDINKEYISGCQYNKDANLSLFVPSNAYYVRLTVLTSSKSSIEIYTDIDLKSFVKETKDKMNEFDTYDYCQIFHKIAGIGDSLMSGELAFWDEETSTTKYVDCYKYSWLSNLCKTIGAEPIHYSRGGQTVKTWLEEKLSVMKSESVKPSAYFIALGTNDATNITLGTVDDCGTDNETFYGMYSKIITEIQNFNPKAKIFCCSLYYNYPANTEAFCNAIREMANKYKCYHIDFLNRYGLYYSQENPFISAGHFTCQGYVRVAIEMKNLINEIIESNLSDFNFLGNDYKEI